MKNIYSIERVSLEVIGYYEEHEVIASSEEEALELLAKDDKEEWLVRNDTEYFDLTEKFCKDFLEGKEKVESIVNLGVIKEDVEGLQAKADLLKALGGSLNINATIVKSFIAGDRVEYIYILSYNKDNITFVVENTRGVFNSYASFTKYCCSRVLDFLDLKEEELTNINVNTIGAY